MFADRRYVLELRGLTYFGRHGAYASERDRGQVFRVDVTLEYEPGELGDDLRRAVDYAAAERLVASVVEGPPLQLIETLADRIADVLLTSFPQLLAVEVTVHKPHAPLGGAFDDVLVRRRVPRVIRAYLGLGSNLGDRVGNLRRAIGLLTANEGLHAVAVSPLYETEPLDVPDQPLFLNAVLAVNTIVSPSRLLQVCKHAEAVAGRVPGIRRGPRVLDVDILLYGGLSLQTPDLTIPHPRLDRRAFCLRPLHDLEPDLVLPDGRRVDDLLATVADQSVRRVCGPEWAQPGEVGDDH